MLALAMILWAAAVACAAKGADAGSPNILFFLADDMG